DLRSSQNIANPLFVFDIFNAMRFLPDADPRFTNVHNYFNRDDHRVNKFRFPDPSRCYRLTPTQAMPHKLLNYYLPSVRAPVTKEDRDSEWFYRQLTAQINMTDEAGMQKLFFEEEEVRQHQQNAALEAQENATVPDPVLGGDPDLDGKYGSEDDIHIPS